MTSVIGEGTCVVIGRLTNLSVSLRLKTVVLQYNQDFEGNAKNNVVDGDADYVGQRDSSNGNMLVMLIFCALRIGMMERRVTNSHGSNELKLLAPTRACRCYSVIAVRC